ncbi:hypothetical protein F2P45_17940, partial [Massilia sp. CCM 8733]|nr:hypothetical protein [Massilia mucilaginosa]
MIAGRHGAARFRLPTSEVLCPATCRICCIRCTYCVSPSCAPAPYGLPPSARARPPPPPPAAPAWPPPAGAPPRARPPGRVSRGG